MTLESRLLSLMNKIAINSEDVIRKASDDYAGLLISDMYAMTTVSCIANNVLNNKGEEYKESIMKMFTDIENRYDIINDVILFDTELFKKTFRKTSEHSMNISLECINVLAGSKHYVTYAKLSSICKN